MIGDLNILRIVLVLLATIFTITYSFRLLIFTVIKFGYRGAIVGSIEL